MSKLDIKNPLYVSLISIGISIIAIALSIYNYIQISEIREKSNILHSLQFVDLPEITEDSIVYGNGTDIIIFEYSELLCPYCARFFIYTFPEIKEKYLDTGIAKYVFKNFIIHGELAERLASYAICIYKEKGYEEYHNYKSFIFEELYDVAFISRNLTKFQSKIDEILEKYRDLEFCANQNKILSLINKDTYEAINIYKFSGTPSFLIAISMNRVTDEKIKMIKDILDSLKPYGFLYNMWISKDRKYLLIGFSGALPIEFFDSLLSPFI
ncbi:MAG: thioredoxin domain-containing protein [Nanopusillaceae archaeon]